MPVRPIKVLGCDPYQGSCYYGPKGGYQGIGEAVTKPATYEHADKTQESYDANKSLAREGIIEVLENFN